MSDPFEHTAIPCTAAWRVNLHLGHKFLMAPHHHLVVRHWATFGVCAKSHWSITGVEDNVQHVIGVTYRRKASDCSDSRAAARNAWRNSFLKNVVTIFLGQATVQCTLATSVARAAWRCSTTLTHASIKKKNKRGLSPCAAKYPQPHPVVCLVIV